MPAGSVPAWPAPPDQQRLKNRVVVSLKRRPLHMRPARTRQARMPARPAAAPSRSKWSPIIRARSGTTPVWRRIASSPARSGFSRAMPGSVAHTTGPAFNPISANMTVA